LIKTKQILLNRQDILCFYIEKATAIDNSSVDQDCIYYLAKVTKSVTLAKRYINGWEICMDKNSYLS